MAKKNGFLGIIGIMLMIIMSACSSESLLNGPSQNINENAKAVSSSDEYVDISVNMPDMGRGWDVAKYSVTATPDESGVEPVTEETTNSSLSMRLKVGYWTFVASGYDSYNNLIYESAGRKHNVTESGSSINIITWEFGEAFLNSFTCQRALRVSVFVITSLYVSS